MRFLDAAIASIAGKQHGVLSLAQLVVLGLSERTVQDRCARGRLHRIHRGVYSLVPRELLTRRGHWMAAVLMCGAGAVVSHRTAAVLHGLLDYNGANTDVAIPSRYSRRRGSVAVHGSTNLTPADLTVKDNIPCTTTARTLLDLADVVERRRLERAFDQTEMMGEFDLRAVEDQLRRNPTRAAARKVKALLDEHYIGSTPTENELEEAFLALCRRIDVPPPELQQWIMLPDGGDPIRADFLWRNERVVVETDGARVHGTAQARQRDPRRDQRLTVYGWRPIRAPWRQVFYRPAELEATLIALLKGR
jgi:predicted transcriptional regulator of viral defense system